MSGVTKVDVSMRSLSAGGGGMALLMARVDPYNTRLVGRWRSNAMLHYLHRTAKSFTKGL